MLKAEINQSKAETLPSEAAKTKLEMRKVESRNQPSQKVAR